MNQLFRWLVLLLSIASPVVLPIPARAIEPERQAYFVKSPRLVDAYTTFSEIRARQATYYFDLAIPKMAGTSLQKVTIFQKEGVDQINFRLDKTTAYIGNHSRKGGSIELANVTYDESEAIITVIFATPVAPGTNLTVGLKPKRNPDFSGEYLFGVTAFPTGEQPYGLYLGVGRLQFIQSGDGILKR